MKYDIDALKRKMLVKYPFFGSVVANVKYKEEKRISTAGTDGETIYYNPEFLKKLSVEQQTFTFAHEVCHIAFNHILRSEGKDTRLWNIATDGVINQFLKRDGLTGPEGIVDMEEAINYDAEQLYDKLLKEKKQKEQEGNQGGNSGQNQQQGGSSQGQSGSGESESQQQSSSSDGSSEEQEDQSKDGNGDSQSQEQDEQSKNGNSKSGEQDDDSKEDVGHDTHSMWEDAVKKHKEKEKKEKEQKEKEQKEGENPSEKKDSEKQNKKDKQKEAEKEIEEKQKELEKMGEQEAFKKNLEDKKRQLEALKNEISEQMSKTAGSSTNRETRKVNDIGVARPLIDWRYVLRETMRYDVDWSYRNATIENGVVIANLEEIPTPETEIVLDTSGSINERLLKNFLRECKNILKHTKLKVGCFDTEFYGFHEIRTEKDIETMKFEGGGGTDFDTAVGAFTKRVENKIVFTDGYADMPKEAIDAIWLVFGDTKINPKGGRVIYIDENQMRRLCNLEIDDNNAENDVQTSYKKVLRR